MSGNRLQHPNAPCINLSFFENNDDNPSKEITDQQSLQDPDDHFLDFFNTQESDDINCLYFDEQEIAIVDLDFMTTGKSELVDDNTITNAEDQVNIATFNDTNSTDDTSEMPIRNLNKQKACSHAGKRPQKRDHASQKHISELQERIYSLFGNYKRFPKRYVKMIHNMICNHLNLPEITREEFRNIQLYFSHYECHSSKILQYLEENREQLSKLFDDYKHKK